MSYELIGPNGERIDPRRVQTAQRRIEELDPFKPENLEKLGVRLGQIHRRQSRELFATEGNSGGPAWTALDPEYAEEKRRAVGNRKILVWDGTMRKDVTREGPNHIERMLIEGTSVVFEYGARNRLAYIHTVEGVRRRIGKVPLSSVLEPLRGGSAKPKAKASGQRSSARGSARARPTFSGEYEFIRRDVLQKTAAQVREMTAAISLHFRVAWQSMLALGLGVDISDVVAGPESEAAA